MMTTSSGGRLDRPATGSILTSRLPGSPQPVHADRFTLAALASAPYWARRLTRQFLESPLIRAREETIDDAELLVSELVTNAAQATPGIPSTNSALPASSIWVSLRHFRHGLLIEVGDTSSQPPVPQHAAADAENGRGLMLVSQLSREWGYYPANRGKVVYCFLHTPESRQAG